ncbi:MAG: hypothetical protein JWL92_205 [Candidatus Nomurabacteria bacterium]|nr:hypothetical protein [Candidatus Nomurabacteria bacterium]
MVSEAVSLFVDKVTPERIVGKKHYMEPSKNYIEIAQELMGILLRIPHVFQNQSSTVTYISDVIKELDEATFKLKQELIVSLNWDKNKIGSIANMHTGWQEVIVEQLEQLKPSELKPLLNPPGLILKLYITQKDFPSDGLTQILDIFIARAETYHELVSLELPLEKIIKKEILEDILDDIESVVRLGPPKESGYVTFIAYIYTFFPKEILYFLKVLEENASEALIAFIEQCSDTISHKAKAQFSLM